MNVHDTTASWSRTATQSRSGRQAGDAGANSAEQVVDVVAEQRRAAGDRQRDENDQHCVFGRGRAAIVTAKAFEQSEHVHTPEIEPVTDPFAPRWNRRGRPAPAKAAYFAVRFGLGRLTGTYVSNFVWFATEN